MLETNHSYINTNCQCENLMHPYFTQYQYLAVLSNTGKVCTQCLFFNFISVLQQQ